MSSHVLVDTNIWQYAFVRPREKEFAVVHELAQPFLSGLLADELIRIPMSSYQVAEIMEVLRKSGVRHEVRLQILRDFEKAKFYVRDLMLSDVVDAIKDSSKSNIHVYDYLVAYPLRGVIDRIYTADEHFLHSDFQAICQISNPLTPWFVTEGKQPEKR